MAPAIVLGMNGHTVTATVTYPDGRQLYVPEVAYECFFDAFWNLSRAWNWTAVEDKRWMDRTYPKPGGRPSRDIDTLPDVIEFRAH